MIAAWAAALAASPQAAAAPAAASGAGWTQETTLDGVGVPAQTLYGRSNEVTAWFPPPPGPPAASGSLVRLVFSHSRLLDAAASTARVLVNGRELGTVVLDAASSDGAVADVAVPAEALETGRPNQLEVRLDVRLAGRPEATADDPAAFVRLESQTALRYQLAAGEGGPPRLDAYPFPLIAVRGTVPTRLGLVMPDPPSAADASTALQLVADLGRRGRGQQVAPEAVTSGQLDWLRTGGLPALAVGALRRLPAAAPLLRAAGFAPRAAGWSTPDGQDVRPEDGIVAAVVSPWDRRSPVILVTGETDAAVARAAAELTAVAGLPGGGTFAVVHPSPAPLPAPAAAGPGDSVTFPELADRALRMDGAGRHVVALAFAAPAVNPNGTGDLALTMGHTHVPAGQPAALGVQVGGTVVGSISLTQDNEHDRSVHLAVPGSALHPGWNTLTLDAGLAGDAASLRVAPDLRLRLPGTPPGRSGLQLLPHAVFDDPGGVHVVLGGGGTTLLTGAARVVAALGGRASALPRLSATYADHARGGAAALVLGVASGSATAAGVAGALGLAETPAPVPAARATGVVRLRQTSGGQPVLWVDGGDPAALSLAGDAIARGVLAGSGATVDAGGRVRILGAGGAPAEPPTTGVVRVLLAIAVGLLVAGVGWLTWRLGSPAGPGGRVALPGRLHAHSVALVAWGAGAAALAIALCPALVAALLTVLVGLVMMATLRTSIRGGLIASGVAAVPFAFAELAFGIPGVGPGALQGFLSSLALEVALLPASAVVASRVPSSLGALAARGGEPAAAADGPSNDGRPALDGRDRGLRRAAWELARAGEYGREVALALVGPDVPVDGVDVVCRLELMEELDALLRERVTRFGVVSEQGPCERLLVLPEESACSLSESGARLCAEASERLGCAVRMALASYPVHGKSVPALLSLLEANLAACRARGIAVQVCGAGHPAGAARDRPA